MLHLREEAQSEQEVVWATQSPPPIGSTTFPDRVISSGPGVEILEPMGNILCSNHNSNLLVGGLSRSRRKLLIPVG